MKRWLFPLVMLAAPTATFASSLHVQTDKSVYYPGETIRVSISADRPPFVLLFSSSCQADYIMDGVYDSGHGIQCAAVLTEVSLPHTWTMTHSWTRYACAPGQHSVSAYLHDPYTYLYTSDHATFTVVPHGDANRDGRVDLLDFRCLADAWPTQPGDPLWDPYCDLAAPKNLIDLNDLLFLALHWLDELP